MALCSMRLRRGVFLFKIFCLTTLCVVSFRIMQSTMDPKNFKSSQVRILLPSRDSWFNQSAPENEQQQQDEHHQQQQQEQQQIQQQPRQQPPPQPPQQQQQHTEHITNNDDINDSSAKFRMARRRDVVARYCWNKSQGKGGKKGPGKKNNPRLPSCPLVSEKRHLFVCPIAKIGSTFLTRFNIVVQEGKGKGRGGREGAEAEGARDRIPSPFNVPLEKAESLRCPQKEVKDISGMTTAVFVREPFSRVFSAYVDKLMSPNPTYWRQWGLPALALSGRGRTPKRKASCGHGITFRQFVHYVVKHLWRVNNHVIPMVEACNPCKDRYDVIGNMETFPSDLDHVMSLINVTFSPGIDLSRETKLDAIYDSIQGPFSWKEDIKACVSMPEMGRRIWRKLQIRGLISSDLDYPLGNADISNMTKSQFYAIAVQAHEKSTDRRRLSLQKKQVFLEAFRSVDFEDIEEYVRVFRDDFDAFGYDTKPKSVFQRDADYTDTKAMDFNTPWRIPPSA